MTVKTAAQALALVKRKGLVTLAAHLEGVPCFVEAVTGERVRGSWWGHPKGKLIFSLAEGLEDSREVLTLKLLEGKATFVDQALWPAAKVGVTQALEELKAAAAGIPTDLE